MKHIKSLTAGFILLTLLFSCAKEELPNESFELQEKAQSSELPRVDMPRVENGILFFKDKDHVDAYYGFLEEYINLKFEDAKDEELDEDLILDDIESQFSGFSSYRKLYNERYGFSERGNTEKEIMEIMKKDYVTGYQKSYLNKDLEVGIGDKVYIFHSNDIILSVDKKEQKALEEIKKIEKGTGILPADLLTKYDVIELSSVNNTMGTKMHLVVNPFLEYNSNQILQNVDCSVYEKKVAVTLLETKKDIDGNIVSSNPYLSNFHKISIDWGDGTPITTHINSIQSGEYVNHTYANMGTYPVHVVIEFFDDNGILQVMSDPPLAVIVENACTEVNGSTFDSTNNGTWMLTGRIDVSNGFLGANRIKGTSEAFKSCGGNCWVKVKKRRHKPFIKVRVDGIFRDANCIQKAHKTGSAQSNKANKKRKSKAKLWSRYDHSNGDVRSEHWISKDGHNLYLEVVFNPC